MSSKPSYKDRRGLEEKDGHVDSFSDTSLKAPARNGHLKDTPPPVMKKESPPPSGTKDTDKRAFARNVKTVDIDPVNKKPSSSVPSKERDRVDYKEGDSFEQAVDEEDVSFAEVIPRESRVGAVAVRGPGFDDDFEDTEDSFSFTDDVESCEQNRMESETHGDPTDGAVVAEPVANDDLEQEILAALHGEITTAEAAQKEVKCWKRRSSIIAYLVVAIALVGGVVGTVLGLQLGRDKSEPDDPNTLRGKNVGDRWGDFAVISRDNSTLAVGSDKESYAIVFRRDTNGEWKQLGQTLYGDGQFGRTLAFDCSGSILAVGSWKNDQVSENAGKAQVYWYNGTSWDEFGSFLGDAASDHFGYFVELSGNGRILAISAREADLSGNRTDAGMVRIYKYSGNVEEKTGSWIQLGPDLQGEDAEEQFGKRLAMNEDGTRIAVSALRWNEKRGRILTYDFSMATDTWIESVQQLEGPEEGAAFGSALDMTPDGTKLVVGSDGKDANGEDSGWVGVFSLNNNMWLPQGEAIVGGEFDRLGIRGVPISDDGNCVAMGGSHYENRTGVGYLYQWTGQDWTMAAQVVGDDMGDNFGGTTSMSGDCKWVVWGGNQMENLEGSGYVKVYEVEDLLRDQENESNTRA